MFQSAGLGTTLQPMSAQEGRINDAKATGCFGKNALTVLHGLSILGLNEEFLIDTEPKKSFFISLCFVKVIAEGFGKQVSRRNVFVYTAVYICIGLFVFVAVHGCGFVSSLSVAIIHNHMDSQLRWSSAERSKETPVALCLKLQAALQKMR